MIDDAAATARMARQLDRYRLLRHVGRGGSSDVFEAEHIHVDKRVALKLLRRELAGDEQAVARLRQEARTTSAIGHRNIVQVEDFGVTADGTVYLAMEWLEGETLAQRIERGPMARPQAIDLVLQVAAGLGAAHAAGVVHRDLKPANVFLVPQPDGRDLVKLLDFGIAKLVRNDPRLTRTGAFVGTADYVAPEQALGEEVDGRADLYALGVVLYQLLTGTLPFRAGSFMAVLHRHATEEPEPPSQRAPRRGVSPALEAVVLRCLAKRREDRHASAEELIAALTAASGIAVRSATPEPAGSMAPPMWIEPPWIEPPPGEELPARRRSRFGLWLTLLVAVGAAGGAALAMLQRPDDPRSDVRGGGAAADAAPVTAPAPGGLDAGPASTPASAAAGAAPPAAPAQDRWRLAGRADGFDYVVSATPAAIRAGQSFQLDVELAPAAGLAAAWRRGAVRAGLTVVHGRTRRVELRGDFALDEAGRLATALTLPRDGAHHIDLVLRDGGRELGRARFDLCVGADPADRAALDRVCPGAAGAR